MTVTDSQRPALAGIHILDLTRLLPGAFATSMLASLGARVTKVEHPVGGDGLRSGIVRTDGAVTTQAGAHVLLDQGKESVALDLKDSRAQEILLRLVSAADVLIDSFRPGVLERLGLGEDELRAANPLLVHVSITAFAAATSRQDWAGHDLNASGTAGLVGQTVHPGGQPVVPAVQNADLAAGFHAALAIQAGLRVRDRDAAGYRTVVSMTDAALTMMPLAVSRYLDTGDDPPTPDFLTGSLATYGVYECSDGEWVTVGGLEPKFFRRMMELLGLIEYADQQYDPGSQENLRSRLQEAFASRTRSEWLRILEPADVCVGPVNSVSQVFEDPYFVESGALWTVPEADGRVTVTNPTPWNRSERPEREHAPALGEDTRALLRSAGITDEQLSELVREGIVAAPS